MNEKEITKPLAVGLKCAYCGYVTTMADDDMMNIDYCPMCERERNGDE